MDKTTLGEWLLNKKVSLYINFDTEYTGDEIKSK